MKKLFLICALLVSSLLFAQDSLRVKQYHIHSVDYKYLETTPDKDSTIDKMEELEQDRYYLQTEYEDGTIKECLIIREEETTFNI